MATAAASSSSSLTAPQLMKYDVFISFRGEDTRNNFTSHLNAALRRKKIKTFIDNQLIRGDEISPSLLNAIEGSKILVIIFSKGYAYSIWCLEELVKILECKNIYGQIVIPIFYHVDPSHVRNQTGRFGDAFEELKERFKERKDMLQRWRIALKEAACLSGWHINDKRPEWELTEEIVKDILKRLNRLSPSVNNDLVGVEFAIERIESLLCIGSNGVCIESDEVCIVGIWGMGGIGKTTIARAVFDKNSNKFEGSCFIENVREASDNNRLTCLQNILLSEILEDGHTNIGLSFTKKRLESTKAFIVFDDVTCLNQIKKIIGDLTSLGSESRIIITTRDKQVLKNCGVDDANIYKVEELRDNDALQLFGQYAFRRNHHTYKFIELSKIVVSYTKGLPLALKLLGSALFSKGIEVWESAIMKLEKGPPLDVQKVLRISFDGLDREEKDIFLDIACFFKGEDVNSVIKILNAGDFSANHGISVLIDKCLIIVSIHDEITMHDLLQEMGREIIREESRNYFGTYNRLWHHKDIYHVLRKNKGVEVIQGIRLDMSKIIDKNLNLNAFVRMDNLRFFDFCCSHAMLELNGSHPYCSCDGEKSIKVHSFECFELDSMYLMYFRWHGYPMKSLPSNFHPNNLVALVMPHCNVEELWNGVQEFDNLKHINLRYSKLLTKIPDLSLAPILESLILEGCTSLIEISSSIMYLDKLVVLNLRDCKSLISLPRSIQSKSLKEVNLSGCSNLRKAPTLPCNLKFLYLAGTAIRKIPQVEHPSSLIELSLDNCSKLECLPSSFCKLKSLKSLTLSGCSKLERLPIDFGDLEALEKLDAEETAIRELPVSISRLKKLVRLSFCNTQAQVDVVLPSFSGLSSLTYLNLSSSRIYELPNSLSELYSIEKLYLCENNFKSIPANIKDLSNLEFLGLSGCKRLQTLPKLPRGLDIDASNCISLEKLSDLSDLFRFNLANCFKLDRNALEIEVKDGPLRKVKAQKLKRAVPVNGCLCYPGNEIPKWFSFQTIGSSMTIELPPDWNKKFLGFAICAVIAFTKYDISGKDIRVLCSCKTKREDGDLIEDRYCVLSAWTPDTGSLHIHQDHVFLGFDLSLRKIVWTPEDKEYIDLSDSNKAIIEFHTFLTSVMIKKCGINFVYTQEAEIFHDCGVPMADNRCTVEEIVEEEEEPQPKRLKY